MIENLSFFLTKQKEFGKLEVFYFYAVRYAISLRTSGNVPEKRNSNFFNFFLLTRKQKYAKDRGAMSNYYRLIGRVIVAAKGDKRRYVFVAASSPVPFGV